MTDTVRILLSLLPVVLFLVGLVFLDSFKLVSPRSVLTAIGAGVVAAVLSYLANGWVQETLDLSRMLLSRYAAPVVEETLKALYVVFLIRGRRVGFMVDAAIYGFAVGAGFALFENIYYLREFQTGSLWLWGIRGFGTAVMHGSVTAIVAMLGKGISDRHNTTNLLVFLPGLLLGIVFHSLYNHVLLHPVLTTLAQVVAFPVIAVAVYERSESATRHWLGTGFDTDLDLLETIMDGEVHETPVGRYLESLKSRFPGEIVADLLCLLQIHLELSVRAKGILLAREAGLDVPVDESVRGNLEELHFLEKAVGTTGKLAIQPFLARSSHDLWQIYMLKQ